MLIRSQNKEAICNLDHVDTIAIESRKENVTIYSYNGNVDTNTTLADYSTKEKAIKVLDMIQEEYQKYFYSEGGFTSFGDEYVQAFGFIPPKVFQMPQDEEVDP